MKKFLIILFTIFASSAAAEDSYGSVDYLFGWQNADGSFQTAVAIDLQPGWKTYWRVAGPAGIPPEFDWSRSKNVGAISWSWPVPKTFHTNGMLSIGYSDTVIIPITITPQNPTEPVNIDVDLFFGVCADICIPAESRLLENLVPDTPTRRVSEIRASLQDRPMSAAESGLLSVRCNLTPSRRGFTIETHMDFANNLRGNQQLIVEYQDPDIWIDIADTHYSERTLTGVAELQYFGSGMLSVDRSLLRLTVIQDNGAVETMGCAKS